MDVILQKNNEVDISKIPPIIDLSSVLVDTNLVC